MSSSRYLTRVFKRCPTSLTPNTTRTLETFSGNGKLHAKTAQQYVKFSSSCNSVTDKYGRRTIADVTRYWHEIFEKEKITEAKESIQHIIASVVGTSKLSDLVRLEDEKLNEEQLERLEVLCECRLSRMPVQYLIGQWDFRDITLKLEPPIFIPRPETEILVELLLQRIRDFGDKPCAILEIGCGSGAICLSLLRSKKNVNVVAIDANPHACELTKENAQRLNLETGLTVLHAKLEESGSVTVKKDQTLPQPSSFERLNFDFIISNPPYIPTKTIFTLEPEVRVYEDIGALDGGDDGLRLVKPILTYASAALDDGGFLILEVDSSHCERIKALVEGNHADKLQFASARKDFNGNDRYVEIKKIKR